MKDALEEGGRRVVEEVRLRKPPVAGAEHMMMALGLFEIGSGGAWWLPDLQRARARMRNVVGERK
jgi:hypothetical protein